MADWADVEFRQTAKRRRVHDALSLAPDILILWDFLTGVACGLATHIIWLNQYHATNIVAVRTSTFLPGIVVGSLVMALLLRTAPLQTENTSIFMSRLHFSAQARSALVTLVFSVVAVSSLVKGALAAEVWIVAWLILSVAIGGATRWMLACTLLRLEKEGAFRETIAILGTSGARDRLAERIASKARIVGLCETDSDQTGLLQQDEIHKLQELSAGGQLDSIVLAFEKKQSEADIAAILEPLKALPMQVGLCDEQEQAEANTAEFRLLAGVPIKIISNRPINRRDLMIKTILDKIAAVILLVVLAPFMVAIALAVLATSRGPIIFRQTREGWCGRRFTMFKFRTMRDVPHVGDRYRQTQRRDPRCTLVGRALRRTSLDELPQLWNVLHGEMSFVGPRPHAEMLDEADRAGREIIAEYAQRFRVKPGITGWAQIHGARGAISSVEQLRQRVTFDLFYIEHWSLWLDCKIVACTPFCMMGKNVF